ncbi:MAG: hypothetical protein ACKOCZ_00210 [Betaproteobacteria bacterium]|nr:hypothetical protein [Betaproteobacteria bacterium]
MSLAREQLQDIAEELRGLRHGNVAIDALIASAQNAEQLRALLPDAFSTVLDNLTDRLQASALFTEESCSFSRTDLIDSLQLWVDKARERLTAAGL